VQDPPTTQACLRVLQIKLVFLLSGPDGHVSMVGLDLSEEGI